MKELFIKILRFLMFVLVVALGCIGYNIYEDTLAAVWIPVGVGLVVAVVTLPLYKKWIWLTTMEQKAVNILCHVVCVGVISCIIRKSKFPQNPKRSVRFSGKRTKRSVQKRKARNTQKAETKVL